MKDTPRLKTCTKASFWATVRALQNPYSSESGTESMTCRAAEIETVVPLFALILHLVIQEFQSFRISAEKGRRMTAEIPKFRAGSQSFHPTARLSKRKVTHAPQPHQLFLPHHPTLGVFNSNVTFRYCDHPTISPLKSNASFWNRNHSSISSLKANPTCRYGRHSTISSL